LSYTVFDHIIKKVTTDYYTVTQERRLRFPRAQFGILFYPAWGNEGDIRFKNPDLYT